MKTKAIAMLIAVLFIGGISLGMVSICLPQEAIAADQIICPKCNGVVDPGSKPVLQMLANLEHNCPDCGKSYTTAEGKNLFGCSTCDAVVYQCPECGKTESSAKS